MSTLPLLAYNMPLGLKTFNIPKQQLKLDQA